jgi:hypothetical protein
MLHIVTVATESKFYFPYLKETCQKEGVNLTVIGFGEKWGGYSWKFKKMVEFLGSVPSTDIVCFVDGYDVICTRNLKQLPIVFNQIQKRENCKIIIAKDDMMYFGAFKCLTDVYFGTCKNMPINSGTYIGFAGNLLDILKDAQHQNPNETDDQKMITQYCSFNEDLFYIDSKHELFFASIKSFREVTIPKDINPFFVHAVGCGFLNSILESKGYKVPASIKSDLSKYFINKAYGHVSTFCKRYILQIICIILLILLIIKLLYK